MAVRLGHLNRYKEITMALVSHGFGYLVEEMGLFQLLSLPKRIFWQQKVPASKSLGERLRLVLEDLGPTFVKLGQLASTRQDLFSEEIIQELAKLQDQVPPFPAAVVRQVIERQLNKAMENIFLQFDDQPLAAASIGQVHRGRLKSGEEVAVKVQRPLVAEIIKQDLEILKDLTRLAERKLPGLAHYRIGELVQDFSKALLTELDYNREGRNAKKFAQQFAGNSQVQIPKIYWEYTAAKVLTMEYLPGVKLKETEKLLAQGYNLKNIAEQLVKAMFRQIFQAGFFHADPHPGNLLVLPQGSLAFLDFGLVGHLDREMKYQLSSLIIALMSKNTEGVTRAILRLGLVSEPTNLAVLHKDLNQLIEEYYDLPLAQISLGTAIQEFFAVAQRHRIYLPSDLALLGKALLILEGIVGKLDAQLSLVDLAQPFGLQLLRERFNPRQLPKNIWHNISELAEVVKDLPQEIQGFSGLLKAGKIKMEFSLPELEFFLRKIDQISNRLSLSIVLLSFSIIIAGLIIATSLSRQPILLWKLPAIEVGFVAAVITFFGLLYSIFKSGRF